MTLLASTLCLPAKISNERECINYISEELVARKAVNVQGNSVVFNPKYMKIGRFYCIEFENKPYLYRKISEYEVEVYGLAEQA